MIKKFIYWFVYWAFWFWWVPVTLLLFNSSPRPGGGNLTSFTFIVLGTGLAGGIGGLVLEKFSSYKSKSGEKLTYSVFDQTIIWCVFWIGLFIISTYQAPDNNMPEIKIIVGIGILIYSFFGALIGTSFYKSVLLLYIK